MTGIFGCYLIAAMGTNRATKAYTRALEVFESVSGMARHLGINRRAVYAWDGVIPDDRKWELYVLAQGRLSMADLEIQEAFNARKLPRRKVA